MGENSVTLLTDYDVINDFGQQTLIWVQWAGRVNGNLNGKICYGSCDAANMLQFTVRVVLAHSVIFREMQSACKATCICYVNIMRMGLFCIGN